MSAEATEGAKTGNDSISSRTSDGQVVYLDSSVIYRIDPNDVIRVHIDLQERYVEDFMRPVMRGIIRTEVSQFTADEVNSSKRKNLEANLEELLREAFSDKGFVLDRFLLRNIAFSPQYASAIEQKQVAEQQRVQAEYQAEQKRRLAEGERDRQKIEAEGIAQAILLKARAEAEALQLIAAALQDNEKLLQFRYIDKLAPSIRVMLVPNNQPYILPLPDMTGDLAPEAQISSPTYTLTTTVTLPESTLLSTPMPTPAP
jgi:regulator of protease activity HflC (stomatin/prohibitin superfamily)